MVGGSIWGFPGGSDSKEPACNAGDMGSIPGLGISPGEGNANPLQYSCLENPMDRRAWWAIVHGVATVGCDLQLNHHHQGMNKNTYVTILYTNNKTLRKIN